MAEKGCQLPGSQRPPIQQAHCLPRTTEVFENRCKGRSTYPVAGEWAESGLWSHPGQALLLTGYEMGQDNLLNLSKIGHLFSLNFRICKMDVIISPLPADLLPKVKYMSSIQRCLHTVSTQ